MRLVRQLVQICFCSAMLLQAGISGAQTITNSSASGYHTLFIKSDGSLWGMGNNDSGSLGDGTYNSAYHPKMVVPGGVTAVAAGSWDDTLPTLTYSLFIRTNGSLWGMGDNSQGQLGIGFSTNRPAQIVASNVTAVAAAYLSTVFLKSNGSLWAMGLNNLGQLGDGTVNNIYVPKQIVASNVVAIAAGGFHTLFIKNDGSLWGMGVMGGGQLGSTNGNTTTFTNRPKLIVNGGVSAIAAGNSHSLFINSNGSLWVMGYNTDGQLGTGNYKNVYSPAQIMSSDVSAVAAGYAHSLFLMANGSLWATGSDGWGQLGDGSYSLSNAIPKQIVADGVTAIDAGDMYSLFVKNDGSLWGMGRNGYGQMGDAAGYYNSTNRPQQLVINPFYNRIVPQSSSNGTLTFSFVGIPGSNYSLDGSPSLTSSSWLPLVTNTAGNDGTLSFTNTPTAAPANFWRVRSAP